MTDRSREPGTRVAVLGLGPMGSALTRALIAAGIRPTVWNRTRSRSEALAAEGALVADNPEQAVRAVRLVITCLRDHPTTRELLGSVPADALRGRTVVVLASATPAGARETQQWATTSGIDALMGAIMVPTPLIGTSDALILYSGRRDLLDAHRTELEVLAPRSEHVGDDPGLASLLDTAMLEVFFAGMTAFLHASAMVTAHGLTAKAFVPWANEMLAILPATLDGLARDVDHGTYPGDEDNLAMELAALRHMVRTSEESGLDSRLPDLMRELAERGVEEGYDGDGWSRVVELIRAPDRPAARRSA